MHDDMDNGTLPDFFLNEKEKETIGNLAAGGVSAEDIAFYMRWPRARRRLFVVLSRYPESEVATLIAEGRAAGKFDPLAELLRMSRTGNLDAIKSLHEFQTCSRLEQFIKSIDDDEFAG